MSKAVLVMDMPNSCDKCPCFCGHYSDMCCMALNNRTINYPYPKDFRQRWCPLKELPEETHKKNGLWTHYNRIIKDNGCIALFAQTPFDKVLGTSNLSMLRYEWIWEKTQATGHLNAKKMPMKAHENILIFYKKLPTYNPQKTTGHTPIHFQEI